MSAPPDDWIIIDGDRLDGVSFANRRLVKFAPIGARFVRCSFEGAVVGDMVFGSGRSTTEFVDCTFDGAKLTFGGGPGYARLVNCSFRKVDLRRLECNAVDLVGCVFSGSVRGGFLKATVPALYREAAGRDRNEIVDNDFSELRLRDFHFLAGVDLSRQRLPTGAEYLYLPDAAGAVAAARAALDSCPPDLVPVVVRAIDFVESLTRDGQRQVFLRRKELIRTDLAAVGWLLNRWDEAAEN